MKAVVVTSHNHIEIRELSVPEPSAYEALVKIEACGLCGTTDRHIIEGHMAHHPANQYPAVLGHEAVGTVVKIGAQVKKFKVGDRVTRPIAIWPGTQRDGYYSAWGGFAEFGIVRDATILGGPAPDYNTQRQHVVPSLLSLEEAVAAISISEVASWAGKLGDLKGQNIVIGGTGFAACIMCQCAKAEGAKNIIAFGRSSGKFDWVKRNGATHALVLDDKTGSAIREINGGTGADWFFEAAGKQAVFEAGLSFLKNGGKAALYGAPDGFAYKLPLGGAGGGDFSVHYVAPADDVFFQETCVSMAAKKLDAGLVLSNKWKGMDSIHEAFREQCSGRALKQIIVF